MLNKFIDEINSLNKISPRKRNKKELKNEVLYNVRDLYNKLHYIYKDKYNQEVNNLNTENKKKLGNKKLRLRDDLYSSEEGQEEEQEEKNNN